MSRKQESFKVGRPGSKALAPQEMLLAKITGGCMGDNEVCSLWFDVDNKDEDKIDAIVSALQALLEKHGVVAVYNPNGSSDVPRYSKTLVFEVQEIRGKQAIQGYDVTQLSPAYRDINSELELIKAKAEAMQKAVKL